MLFYNLPPFCFEHMVDTEEICIVNYGSPFRVICIFILQHFGIQLIRIRDDYMLVTVKKEAFVLFSPHI